MPNDNAAIEEIEQGSADTEGSQDVSVQQDVDQTELDVPEVNWENKYQEILGHNKALNKRLVDATRQSNSQQRNPYEVNDENTASFQQNLKLASADVREGVERLLSLYPELPNETVSQIRKNPLAFVNGGDFFQSLNVPNALIDIETHMYSLVENIGGANEKGVEKQPIQQVRPSRAPVGEEQPEEGPSKEDLWTMPIDDLEKIVRNNKRKVN